MCQRVSQHPRAGSVILEAILALPILVLVTFAAIQYGETIIFEQAVVAAADEAAREAAKGATAAEVGEVVDIMLSPFGLVVGPGVRVDIEQTVIPVSVTLGDNTVPAPPAIAFATPPNGMLEQNEIRVTLQVTFPTSKVPNVLEYFGIDFSTKRFRSSALSRRQ